MIVHRANANLQIRLYGAIEFVQHCRAAQLQLILGVDFTFEADHSLTLLAQNMEGYANLCRLVTRLQAAADREAALARGRVRHDRRGLVLVVGSEIEVLAD